MRQAFWCKVVLLSDLRRIETALLSKSELLLLLLLLFSTIWQSRRTTSDVDDLRSLARRLEPNLFSLQIFGRKIFVSRERISELLECSLRKRKFFSRLRRIFGRKHIYTRRK